MQTMEKEPMGAKGNEWKENQTCKQEEEEEESLKKYYPKPTTYLPLPK